MLQVHHFTKRYGAHLVLDDVSFLLNAGERVGLIGPNGSGKSTLLRCITGEEPVDSGVIVRASPDLRLGYLPQALAVEGDGRVGDLLDAAQAALVAAECEVNDATAALAADGGHAAAYDDALARFEALGGYARLGRAAAVLDGLGLAGLGRDTPVARLSGGQKTRLGLAALLLGEPDLLLLDEPTNHLDLDALTWLEAFVQGYPGAVLVVSHDREFLDRTVERILYLDGESRTLTSYPGAYTEFAAARAHEAALHREAWTRQQEYVGRVGADIARLKGEAVAIERGTTPRQPGVRKLAKKKARLAKSREKKLDRYLASEERVEKPRPTWGLKLDFGPPPASGRAVLRLEDVSVGYPGRPPLLERVNLELWHGERLAVVGPNGEGKTTLLRLIAGALEPRAGRIRLGAGVKLGLLAQEGETLDGGRTVLETAQRERPMSETEARRFLHYFLFAGEGVHRRVDACSHGERTRLQLALLVLRGCNLLLLDEPLNHLDIEGRDHFEAALAAFAGTVIAVSHDRAFLRNFADRAVEVRDGAVTGRDA